MKLSLPVLERRLGYDDEMWARDAEMEFEVAKERNRLQRLAETLK